MKQDIPVLLDRPLFDRLEWMMREIACFCSPSMVDRVDGVSAVVLTRDEPLCYDSVESILPLVDEVIVVDCGKKKAEFPKSDKLQYLYTYPNQNIQFKHALLLSKYRWLLRWDADFLSNIETRGFVEMLRGLPKGYWQVKCRVANVNNGVVDSYQNEAYAFTYHPLILVADVSLLKRLTDILILMKGGMKNRICYNMLPYFFRMKKTCCVYADHHYMFKSKERLKERAVQAQWILLSDRERAEYGDYDEYVQSGGERCQR